MAVDRLREFLREEYKDANQQREGARAQIRARHDRAGEGGLTSGDELVINVACSEIAAADARQATVARVVSKINEEFGTDFRKDATRSGKKKDPAQ